jgi:hypothetical protein
VVQDRSCIPRGQTPGCYLGPLGDHLHGAPLLLLATVQACAQPECTQMCSTTELLVWWLRAICTFFAIRLRAVQAYVNSHNCIVLFISCGATQAIRALLAFSYRLQLRAPVRPVLVHATEAAVCSSGHAFCISVRIHM